MPKQPFISIPLDIPNLRVLQTDLTQADEFILTVESTLTTATCRQCGRTLTEQHGEDRPRLLRHLPILGRVVYLRIRPKRFRCPYCDDHPTTTQELEWYDPNALHTKAYERHLIVQLVNSTVTDVVAKEDVSYDALLGILDRWIATTVDWDALEPFATMGIDEIALLKGHRDFVAVISLIANYFIDHQTSSFVEGLNNKLKVLKRRCYGLRNVVRLFQRLTLDLDGYRRFSFWYASTSGVRHIFASALECVKRLHASNFRAIKACDRSENWFLRAD